MLSRAPKFLEVILVKIDKFGERRHPERGMAFHSALNIYIQALACRLLEPDFREINTLAIVLG